MPPSVMAGWTIFVPICLLVSLVDKQKVIATARKFTTRTQFQRAFNGAYKAARENGWADEAMGAYGKVFQAQRLLELRAL